MHLGFLLTCQCVPLGAVGNTLPEPFARTLVLHRHSRVEAGVRQRQVLEQLVVRGLGILGRFDTQRWSQMN
jgi:hypothetical protein